MTDWREDLKAWAPVAACAIILIAVYQITHEYPANISGLYLEMASQIPQQGWSLPRRIPNYTQGGIPFVYPPLMHFIGAFLLSINVSWLSISLWFPSVLLLIQTVPAYTLSKEILGQRLYATAGASVLILTPAFYQWHLAASGWVRGGAYLWLLSGLSTGYKLYSQSSLESRLYWISLTGLFFGLTVLSHPILAVFFAVSIGSFWLGKSRQIEGFLSGLLVAIIGFMVSSPWWLTVLRRHGLKVFLEASGTHGGLGQSFIQVSQTAVRLGGADSALFPFVGFSGIVITSLWLLTQRRLTLPVWLLVSLGLFSQARYAALPATFVGIIFLSEVIEPTFEESADYFPEVSMDIMMVVGVCLIAASGGLMFASNATGGYSAGFSDGGVESAEWIKSSTPSNSTIAGVGTSVEWVPYISNRTLVIGHWGSEWDGKGAYTQQKSAVKDLSSSSCEDADCVTDVFNRTTYPNYFWVPRQSHLSIFSRSPMPDGLETSLNQSRTFEPVHVNQDVIVYRVSR